MSLSCPAVTKCQLTFSEELRKFPRPGSILLLPEIIPRFEIAGRLPAPYPVVPRGVTYSKTHGSVIRRLSDVCPRLRPCLHLRRWNLNGVIKPIENNESLHHHKNYHSNRHTVKEDTVGDLKPHELALENEPKFINIAHHHWIKLFTVLDRFTETGYKILFTHVGETSEKQKVGPTFFKMGICYIPFIESGTSYENCKNHRSDTCCHDDPHGDEEAFVSDVLHRVRHDENHDDAVYRDEKIRLRISQGTDFHVDTIGVSKKSFDSPAGAKFLFLLFFDLARGINWISGRYRFQNSVSLFQFISSGNPVFTVHVAADSLGKPGRVAKIPKNAE